MLQVTLTPELVPERSSLAWWEDWGVPLGERRSLFWVPAEPWKAAAAL